MSEHGYEPVLVENDWYDGPRSGLAYVHGVLSYFESSFADIQPNEPDDIFLVWPASTEAAAWEREQWANFADWNQRREAGCASAATHPGHGGIDARYDELQALLERHRLAPDSAQRFHARWRFTQSAHRYHRDGVDYEALWTLCGERGQQESAHGSSATADSGSQFDQGGGW